MTKSGAAHSRIPLSDEPDHVQSRLSRQTARRPDGLAHLLHEMGLVCQDCWLMRCGSQSRLVPAQVEHLRLAMAKCSSKGCPAVPARHLVVAAPARRQPKCPAGQRQQLLLQHLALASSSANLQWQQCLLQEALVATLAIALDCQPEKVSRSPGQVTKTVILSAARPSALT